MREEVAAFAGASSLRPQPLLAAPSFTVRATVLREQHAARVPRVD